jgi:hypothetical protein
LKDAAAADEEIQKASKAKEEEEIGEDKNFGRKTDILGDEDDKDVIF